MRSSANDQDRASAPVPRHTSDGPDAVVIEVRDSSARLVPGVRLVLANAAGREVRNEELDDGVMRLAADAPAGLVLACRVTISLPGRVVSPPIRLAKVGVFTVDAGATGTLRVVCKRARNGTRLQIHEVRDGMVRGATGFATMNDGIAVVHVAAGDVTYRVGSTDSGTGLESRPFAGPRTQGDVVDAAFDPLGCRVTGCVDAPEWSFTSIRATLSTAGETQHYNSNLAADGSFVFTMPRVAADSLTFTVLPGSLYVCPPTDLDVDERDLGSLTKVELRSIGVLEVRDPSGQVLSLRPDVRWCANAAGQRIDSNSPDAFVHWKVVDGVGMECRVGPGVTEIAIDMRGTGWVAQPRTLVVRDGGTFRVNLVPGGDVVVLLTEPGATKPHEVWLESLATNERVAPAHSRFEDRDEGLQHHEFVAVPVGRYRVVAKDAEIVGDTAEVVAGSTQQIRVSVGPR